jgi:hypothetical protein
MITIVKYFLRAFLAFSVVLVAVSMARAFELDALLPDTVPGYATPFGVTDYNRLRHIDNSAGISIGGLNLNPSVQLGGGYDSAPNGAQAGSALLQETPSLLVSDPEMGLGAFISGPFQQYPSNAEQNLAGTTLALGQRMLLPRETITLSAAYLHSQETGFALTNLALHKPIAFTLADARASDKIAAGMFEFTPEIAVRNYRFNEFSFQNRVDISEGLTSVFDSGGPAKLVLRLNATQSRYRQSGLNADTNEALAGISDKADGLWNIKLLAGAAQRRATSNGTFTAPVVELALDWMPDELDKIRLHLAHEIDNPEQISAEPYTLTQAKFSLAHEYLQNIILNASLEIDSAAYLHSSNQETITSVNANFNWHLNANMAIDGSYIFNDRQANFLRAANEHILTLGVTWTP